MREDAYRLLSAMRISGTSGRLSSAWNSLDCLHVLLQHWISGDVTHSRTADLIVSAQTAATALAPEKIASLCLR